MIPTFEQCMEVVNTNEAFTHKVEVVDNHKFHIFNYRLANYEDFMSHPAALEMRGLTFLERFEPVPRRHIFEPFIHLDKFFNLNQGGDSEEVKYAGQKITRVQNKEDGSMIVPVVVDGQIYFKTRGTFGSSMAVTAKKIADFDEGINSFILAMDGDGLVPIFEYVSPFNKIVLDYPRDDLVLLQVRDKKTGRYIQFDNFAVKVWRENFNLSVSPSMVIPDGTGLEFWQDLAVSETNIEGWVITFENGHMLKLKTEWYTALHHLLTENLTRENEIISWVLNETLDDVLGQVPVEDVRRKYALDIAVHVRGLMNNWVDEIDGIMITLDPKRPNSRKNFAIKYKEHRFFGVLMRCFSDFENRVFDQENIFKFLKEFLLKQTNKWDKAREFLKSTGFVSEHSPDSNKEE